MRTLMTSTTRTFGIVLIALGVASYFLTGRTSMTALIPAIFGALFVILALVARSEAARKHAMHGAVMLALIGSSQRWRGAVPAFWRATWRVLRCWRSGDECAACDLHRAWREVGQGTRAARVSRGRRYDDIGLGAHPRSKWIAALVRAAPFRLPLTT